ncbi:MAG: alpha/beta hydrolase [Acidobacteriota bacterium]|nr:alpha/beta hydrolase [Acidobacteriota bacterium]
MDRRSFLKLAAAGPALVGPVSAGCTVGNAEGYASGTAIGSQPSAPQTDFTFYSPLAEAWYRAGDYFEWTSTTRNNAGRRVNVFYRTFGNRSNPALVLLHGYPTSSFDFREMISFLEEDYFVAVLDFPGFGFSDKPQDGYSYMLEDDAMLVDHFVREIVGLSRFHLLTHDRGGSVGFALLGNYLAQTERQYDITYHFISNGGLFLPLTNLGQGRYQRDAPQGGRLGHMLGAVAPERPARPRVTEGTPQQVANADIQAFNDGIGARFYVGKYLLERAANEYRWLDNLRESPVPTALIWGLQDTPNPPRIGNHIWYNYLDKRPVESSYWLLPTAGHYPQRDEPEEMAGIVRTCLEVGIPTPEGEDAFMRTLARNRTATSPVYMGRSIIENVYFPGAVAYSPDGYSF